MKPRLSRKAVRVLLFLRKSKKDLCDKTKCQKDKVISKQLSENKVEGVKWGR